MIHIIILFIKKLLLLCRRIFMPHRRISVPLDEDGLQPMFSGFLHGVTQSPLSSHISPLICCQWLDWICRNK